MHMPTSLLELSFSLFCLSITLSTCPPSYSTRIPIVLDPIPPPPSLTLLRPWSKQSPGATRVEKTSFCDVKINAEAGKPEGIMPNCLAPWQTSKHANTPPPTAESIFLHLNL
jgi:hypothetical protein